MKKRILYHLILILIGNLLIIQFSYKTTFFRLIVFIGGSIIFYSIFSLIFYLTDKLDTKKSINDTILSGLIIILFGIHIYGYIKYNNYQIKTLTNKGIILKAIVNDVKWESRSHGKSRSEDFYIYYNFTYNNKIYTFNDKSWQYKIGDTIKIKLLPNNPYYHELVKEK